MQPHPRTGVALVLAAAMLWGTTGTAQSFVSSDLSAGWFGALRLAVASAFFAAYAWVDGRRWPDPTPRARLPHAEVLGAGIAMAVYNLAFFAGIRTTGIAIGTAVALGSGPLWAGMLQALVTRQVPGVAWWIGTAVAVTGGVLMTMTGGRGVAEVDMAGVMLCLLSGLSYAVYSLLNQRLVRVASAATITFRAFTVAALIAVPVAWLDAGVPVMTGADTWAVAYVGIITAGIAYLLFSHALRHITVATAVTLALGEPVMAFALAVLVVGEHPPAWAYGGLLLVVGGVLLVVRAELRAARHDGGGESGATVNGRAT